MALELRKSVTVNGESKVAGKTAVYFTANLSTDDENSSSVNQNIIDQELYQSNRKECRKDATVFQEAVYEVEDQLAEEAEKEQAD